MNIEFLCENWDGPNSPARSLFLQETLCPASGLIEVMESLVHFSGQVDARSIGSSSALQNITTCRSTRKFTAFFDLGIRTGSDVIKAIAMGALGALSKQEVQL